MGGQPPIDDNMLIQLARQRLAAELSGRGAPGGGGGGGGGASVVNNVYGGGQLPGGGGGQMPDALGGGQMPPQGAAPGGGDNPYDPQDYMVDIIRQEYPEGSQAELVNPGDPNDVKHVAMPHGGWVKRVHRWVQPKKKAMDHKAPF